MNKRLKLLLIGLAVLILFTGCTQQSKVAVVDMQKIVENSDRIQDYQQQLDKKLKELQTEYKTKLNNIDDEEKLKVKREEAYQKSQKIKSDIESKVKADIQKVISEIAKEQEIDVVLNKNDVKYGGVDITDQVIKALKK
ncbi:OmpH family outer membrane protein [Sporohalobacter salinus]|uniref:OmpH family outer membrane protein n=1 Tax=Sporohalobacter salinus TaxID=1494606 RepID=UPI00195F340E|nr:OmpH family outer membrane protein [Sporohalobacter salinus]MBM7622918.1 outer membrane protein [Sporohalobacter salinus]